jgi:hypothetical protein
MQNNCYGSIFMIRSKMFGFPFANTRVVASRRVVLFLWGAATPVSRKKSHANGVVTLHLGTSIICDTPSRVYSKKRKMISDCLVGIYTFYLYIVFCVLLLE